MDEHITKIIARGRTKQREESKQRKAEWAERKRRLAEVLRRPASTVDPLALQNIAMHLRILPTTHSAAVGMRAAMDLLAQAAQAGAFAGGEWATWRAHVAEQPTLPRAICYAPGLPIGEKPHYAGDGGLAWGCAYFAKAIEQAAAEMESEPARPTSRSRMTRKEAADHHRVAPMTIERARRRGDIDGDPAGDWYWTDSVLAWKPDPSRRRAKAPSVESDAKVAEMLAKAERENPGRARASEWKCPTCPSENDWGISTPKCPKCGKPMVRA